MAIIEYKGFGGLRLSADVLGDENDPAVLLLPEPGQGREVWRAAAEALVQMVHERSAAMIAKG